MWGWIALPALLGITGSIGLPAAAVAEATKAEAQRGHDIVQAKCSGCHAIELTGDSPFQAAAPFRTLHRRYPLENLEEALAEGIMSGHPAMPEFVFEPDEVGDIIAYLKSLRSE